MSTSSEMSSLTLSENEENKKKYLEGTDSEVSEEERETWGRKSEFILALVGYSVGLGNVWRFPYLCYRNGGGAFLIPYITFVLIAGVPMFFLEISLGQYTRQTALGVWKLVPSMKGIGYGSAVINGLCAIYYVLVMAWSALYLFHSCMPGPLPWTSCDNWWNSEECVNQWENLKARKTDMENITAISENTTLYNTSVATATVSIDNATSPEVEFWNNYVLRKSSGIEDMGGLENWPIILCFLASWLVIYFCVFKGIRSSGKVVYISATLPYIMLFVLLFRGLTLEGAMDGVVYLLKPNFTKLAEAQVWVDAGGQIFYSYGICFTVLITFGSYNKFNNNCYKQAIVLATTCSLTSLIASFAIFSILGHMAFAQSKDIEEVATQGPGLVFQVFPTGLSLLPCPRLWSILFFATLFMVGIDTQFAGVEGTIAVIVERFPWMGKGKYGTEKVSALISLALLFLGLPLLTNEEYKKKFLPTWDLLISIKNSTPMRGFVKYSRRLPISLPWGGIYVFELYNMYAVSGICLLFITFFEAMTIGWVYGVDNYFENVKTMIGYYPSVYFKYCYRFFTPALTVLIFIFYSAKYKPLVLDGYVYPPWANAVGWMLSLSSMLCIPAVFVWFLRNTNGSLKSRISTALRPGASPIIPQTVSEKV